MPTKNMYIDCLLEYSKQLSNQLDVINIKDFIKKSTDEIIVYNVYDYAWSAWKYYVQSYANKNAHILLLGINPGPHGMVQTGIPFGNISTVRDWLKITPTISKPKQSHPKRPVLGMQYTREELSGKLLWATIKEKYPNPKSFFKYFFVLNYCPLAFFDRTGKNLTPDKLPKEYRKQVESLCTEHLNMYISELSFTHVLGIGKYSAQKSTQLLSDLSLSSDITVHYLTHPSPLNPNHKKFPEEFNTLHDVLIES